MRGFNFKKAVQALNYFAIRCGGDLNKMKAIKLIWLSDRFHLRNYGRTITGDSYFALPNGPIPSATRDILESYLIPDSSIEYSSLFIETIDRYTFCSISEIDFKVFSKTDIEVLDLIYNNFGHLNHFELSELSHLFPEWSRYKSALESKISSRFAININDFFINTEEKSNLFIDSEQNLEYSKTIFEQYSTILNVIGNETSN
jgi:hypothetical protein